MPPSAIGFDAWESLGNSGWGWKDIAPYFRKFHTLELPKPELREHVDINWIDDSVRATDGPIKASFTDSVANPLGKAFVETFKTLGAGLTGDPFSGRSTGGFSCTASIDTTTGTRSYAASGYLAPARDRPNLKVETGATARKVLIEGSSDGAPAVAVGVVYNKDGIEYEVRAKREVVLAAGAFQTPKLLELSGVGDKTLLEKYGIPCKVDSPGVGENLQDHIMTGVSFEVADGIMTGDSLLRREPILETFMKLYEKDRTGPLAAGSLTSYAFMPIMSAELEKLDAGTKSSLEKAIEDLSTGLSNVSAFERAHGEFVANLLQDHSEGSGAIFGIPAQVNLHNGPRQIGMTTDPVPGNYLSLGAALMHPLSRGSSHISSSDVDIPPTVDPRYLSHPLDIEVFARHLMFVEVLARTQPLTKFLKPNGRRRQPGPNSAKVDTLDKAKEYIRATTLSDNHPVGTCAMLPRDKGGVVDSELRVYGVEGLRVVDSSVMPIIPRANTQTTVYAVAEKAADLIKAFYRL